MLNVSGKFNVSLGRASGWRHRKGDNNVFIGTSAGQQDSVGVNNTYIGANSGLNIQGSNNVFLGYESGNQHVGDNNLAIANSDTATLIYGDFEKKFVIVEKHLAINKHKYDVGSVALDVNGTTRLGDGGAIINKVLRKTYNSVGTGDIAAFASYTFPSFTVSGAREGATVSVSPGSDLPDGIVISYARVIADDTVIIKVQNATNVTQNFSGLSWHVTIIQ